MAPARRDHYQLLEVRQEASGPEIRAAFLAKARLLHPDRFPEPQRPAAEVTFRALSEAYETLADPVRRADYDARRQLRRVWEAPPGAQTRWGQVQTRIVARWGIGRLPWYAWLLVGPAALGVAAVVIAQFFFYYVFIIGMVFLVPLIAAWYAWLLWKPLVLVVLIPSCWLWGFLVQGMWRNRQREIRDRTAPMYRQSL